MAGSSWGKTPRESVEQECARRGKAEVVAGCVELLAGGDGDAELILALGGPPARWVVTGGPLDLPTGCGSGHCGACSGPGTTGRSVRKAALNDDAWRVREMALKVVARHRLEDAPATVADLQQDPAARVRALRREP